jgi:hypothetical protein
MEQVPLGPIGDTRLEEVYPTFRLGALYNSSISVFSDDQYQMGGVPVAYDLSGGYPLPSTTPLCTFLNYFLTPTTYIYFGIPTEAIATATTAEPGTISTTTTAAAATTTAAATTISFFVTKDKKGLEGVGIQMLNC